MQFKPLEEYIEIPKQELTTPERNGFVVVEWGGTEIKQNENRGFYTFEKYY